MRDLALAAGICTIETDEREAAKLFIESVKYLNRFMNIPTKLTGIKKEDIEELSKRADTEANPVYPVPVLMDREKLKGFYYDIMEEPINALEEIMKRAIKQTKEEKELILR